jgi:AAA+ superfamily predicted ATPase
LSAPATSDIRWPVEKVKQVTATAHLICGATGAGKTTFARTLAADCKVSLHLVTAGREARLSRV